jgi:hypothetical protein
MAIYISKYSYARKFTIVLLFRILIILVIVIISFIIHCLKIMLFKRLKEVYIYTSNILYKKNNI